jgi:hypothetical protein
MIDQVTSEMTRLPDLAPPASLAANVMARIARLPDRRSQVSPAAETSRARAGHARGERLAWTWSLAGLVIVFGTYVSSRIAAGAPLDLTSSRIGNAPLITMPAEEPAMFLLALGMLLYLAALFSPLRRAASKDVARPRGEPGV